MGPATPPRKNSLATETETREKTAPGGRREAVQANGLMKDGDQTRKEVFTPMADLLTPKTVINIGCWNMRTLYQTGRLAQVLQEMHQYKISLLGIMEARWTGAGKRQLSTRDTILWSGREDNQHRQGVALIIQKEKGNTLLEWKPITERFLYARLKSRFIKLSVVTCYAPTEEAEKEEKDNFYDSLRSILEDIPKHDVLVVLGDFNARVGSDNTNRERIMGKHGTGTMTDNGSRLCDICGENDLVIGGTLFQHKTIHKLTWRSPDGRTESQIDHILVNGKWRRSLQDVKTRRLADVGSDHNLLIGKLALKLRKAKTGEKKKERFDTTKLQNPETKQQFTIALKNSFGILQEETEMTIHSFNMAMELAGKAVLGYRRAKKEQWISTSTWDKIDQRKGIKKKLLTTKSPRLKERLSREYSQKDKEVKRSTRVDKRTYIENLAEAAARRKDMKSLYQITKKLKGDTGPNQNLPLKDADGKIITVEKEKIERWKEHFQQVLNRADPPRLVDIPESADDLEINLDQITEAEVREAIKAQKNGKSTRKR